MLVTPAGIVKVPEVLKVCVWDRPLFTKNKFAITIVIAIIEDLRKNFFILLWLETIGIGRYSGCRRFCISPGLYCRAGMAPIKNFFKKENDAKGRDASFLLVLVRRCLSSLYQLVVKM
jgi:hypothetical protein